MKMKYLLLNKLHQLSYAGLLMVFFCHNLQGQITQVGTAATASSVDWGSTTLTINKPSGISVGDIMIANISQATDPYSRPLVPAGTPTSDNWVQIATNNSGFDNIARGTLFYKIANATDADAATTSYTFNLGANHKAAGAIVAFTGINKDNPFISRDIGTMDVTGVNDNVSCSGITTSADNALVILFAMDFGLCGTRDFKFWATTNEPNSLVENYDYSSTTTPLVHVGAAWAIKENAGPTGSGTLSDINCASYATRKATAILLALRPEKSVSITGPASICAVSGTTTLLPTSGGTWVSSDPTVASVTDAGVVTGVAGGTAFFTFTADGNAWSATTGAVTVNSSITPMVTIVSDLAGNKECVSQKVLITFTANTSNIGGGVVSYLWYLNGRSIDGVTENKLYDNSEIEDGDVVSCVITVTGNTSCLTSATATSNEITTRVYPEVQPTVRIESTDADNEICDGANVTFTAIPENTNGGVVSYSWYLNGQPIGSFDQKTWYNNGESDNGDRVSCRITVTNAACFGTATAASNEITITVNPTGGTATTSTPNVCPGKTAVLTLTGYLGSIQWMYYDEATGNFGNVTGGTGSTSDVYTTPPLTQSTQFFAKVSGGVCEPTISNLVPLTVTSNCSEANDCFEPNNTMSSSLFTIPENYEITASLTNSKDVDWYIFETGLAGNYTLNYGVKANFDLINSKGQKLRAAGRNTPNTYSLSGSTKYYVKVSGTGFKTYLCYTLKIIFDGAALAPVSEAYEAFKSAKITDPGSEGNFSVWPNPTRNDFQFYNGTENPVKIIVLDLTGRTIEIIENIGSNKTIVFGNTYKSGLYLIKVFSGNAKWKTIKAVKQ